MTKHQEQYHDLYDKDLVGLKVIVRDNEKNPAFVGEIVGWYDIHGKQLPMVKHNGMDYICPSLILPYDERLFQFINSMDPKEAWDLFASFSLLNQEVHRRMR